MARQLPKIVPKRAVPPPPTPAATSAPIVLQLDAPKTHLEFAESMKDPVFYKLSKARAKLLTDKRFLFWATIGMYQEPIEHNNMPFKTMATDGFHLFYDRGFIEKITFDDLVFTLIHEAGHCALGHHMRRGLRDQLGWNLAADYALNQTLEDAGLQVPKDCLLNAKYKGMCAEEIYNQLPVMQMTMPDGQSCWGYVLDSPGMDPSTKASTEKRWEIIVRQAALTAKSQGRLPGDFEYLLAPVKPKLNVNEMLRHLMSVVQEDDYSWTRPRRKYIWQNMYLPSLGVESIGDIVVAIDVSGSISHEEAAKFLGLINLVLADVKPKKLHFIQCDAAIQHHEEIPKGEMLPSNVGIKGCGGTDMRPIWEYLDKNNIKPCVTVVCSDFEMDQASFGKKQEFPVLWVTCGKEHTAPWGQTVRLDS